MEMLSVICYMIIGFCIIMYVLLDGFDLGIGILFPFYSEHDKNLMMSTILPVWDGNQTWLVLGIACLYGAFPNGFSLVMPALYLPLLIMVIALLLRGITFEFRLKEKNYRWLWNYIFFISSTIATFSQGLLVGAFVKGFDINAQGHLFLTILTPFNITCGIALLFGYAFLGSTWTITKTTGPLQNKMYRTAFLLLWIVAFFLCVISLWSPFINNDIWDRWFSTENFPKVLPLPLFTAAVIVYCSYCIQKKREYIIHSLAVLIFICSYIGFGISTWPYLVPHFLTIWEVAAPPSSQIFLLVGALLLLPVLLGYTFYAYYIFRDKVVDAIEY